MNTSVSNDLLLNLNSAVSNQLKTAPKQPLNQGFKQEFDKQIVNNTNSPPASSVSLERNSRAADKLDLKKDVANLDKNTNGENLPIGEEAGNFLAALPQEEREELLDKLAQWLAGLSDEQLSELKEQLASGQLNLSERLPKELADLLARLQTENPESLKVVEGFNQLVAGLLNADINVQQLAGIQLNGTQELRLVYGEAPSLAANNAAPIKADMTRLEESLNKPQASLKNVITANSDNKEEANSKLDNLISSLNKAAVNTDARATSNQALNQLLEAAGQGLVGGQAAGAATQTVSRFAAGFATPVPMMMQAANAANAQALANRISIMNAQNMQVAEMRLDPPNLGSVRIQLRLQGDQASIVFQAPNAQARDLLENSLPRLREMLEAEGMQLTDASVSEESFANQDKEGSAQSGFAGSGSGSETDFSGEEQIHVLTQPLGLIDYYA